MRGCVARAAKKNDSGRMPNKDPQALAALALRAFLRRLLKRMANEAQADSLTFRKALERYSK